MSHDHRKEPGIETKLSVREAPKRDGEEEEEGGKRTEKSIDPGDAPGTGDCRSARPGAKLSERGKVPETCPENLVGSLAPVFRV